MTKHLTEEGLNKLKKELEFLKTEKRLDISRRIKEAASFGDLKENAAYTEAKEEQAFLEGKIQELEAELRDVKIIEKVDNNIVQIGSTVIIDSGLEKEEYHLVDKAEADLLQNKISISSPLGEKLIGKKIGDSIVLNFDDTTTKYIIKEIK